VTACGFIYLFVLLGFQTFSCAHQSSLTSEAFDVYVAICDYEAADENEISVKAGDLVEILDYCDYNPTAK
jgi:Variant SH3 domain